MPMRIPQVRSRVRRLGNRTRSQNLRSASRSLIPSIVVGWQMNRAPEEALQQAARSSSINHQQLLVGCWRWAAVKLGRLIKDVSAFGFATWSSRHRHHSESCNRADVNHLSLSTSSPCRISLLHELLTTGATRSNTHKYVARHLLTARSIKRIRSLKSPGFGNDLSADFEGPDI